jgi:hypothetical protein
MKIAPTIGVANAGRVRRLAPLLAPLFALLAACAVGVDGPYGGGAYGGDGYAGAYYEPFGYDYGGWGGGYHVGPARGGERGRAPESHSYRSAPAGHATPSIPSRGGRGGRR